MRRILLLLALCWPAPLAALEPTGDPNLAAVRIKSHGASGTIIATSEGKSWILSCAHMLFDSRDRIDPGLAGKKFRLDGPVQPYAPKQTAEVTLLAVDGPADLSLLEIANGPFHYVPIAPRGHKPSRSLRSVGYDNLAWPVTNEHASLLATLGEWTYTREKPWHGRSGGGLIDLEGRCLIGVVHGYEVTGRQRGIYVSHDAVLRFIDKHLPSMPRPPRAVPDPAPRQRYAQPCPS